MIPVIVLQARFASTRLPGKAVAPLAGRPILTRCLTRLQCAGAAPVILATTTNREDDRLAALAVDMGVAVFRGSERDVLRRTLLAAQQMHATHVVRATADNPAVDIDAPARVLRLLHEAGVDYAAEEGLPVGAGVEAMTMTALAKAEALALRGDDREHVTLMMKRDRLFTSIAAPAPVSLCHPDLRFTIDTLPDLAYLRRIMERISDLDGEPPLARIIAAAKSLAPDGAMTLPAVAR